MTVQHVHVAEGGQAIVGNVSTPVPRVGENEKAKERPLALGYVPSVEMPRQSKRSGLQRRAPAVCRMHGASGGAPKGNRNVVRHGEFTAESVDFKKAVAALCRTASKTMTAIE